MKALNVEFLPKKDWKGRLLTGGATLAAILAVFQLLHAGLALPDIKAVRSANTLTQDSINRLRSEHVAAQRANPYDTGAQAALNSAQFPLESSLSSLENAAVPGVQMVALNLNLIEGTAKAELEAQSDIQLEKYLTRLNESANHSQWRVVKIDVGEGTSSSPSTLAPGLQAYSNSMQPTSSKSIDKTSAILEWSAH